MFGNVCCSKTIDKSSAINEHSSATVVARTTPFRKIEKVLKSYIFRKNRRLEKFTGASFAEIGLLVKMLLNFKVGAC